MPTKNDIHRIKSLSKKQERDTHGLFVAEGEKLCAELIASSLVVREVYYCDALQNDSFLAALRRTQPQAVAEKIPTGTMERISQLKTPTKYLITLEIPRYGDPVLEGGIALALDGVQDPGNLGTIIRTADWFGVKDIFCSLETADAYSPKVIQATMGAISRIRIHYTDLYAFLSQHNTLPIYGTFLEGNNIYREQLSQEGIIVMGNEGNGISQGIASKVSDKLFIPPFAPETNGCESLNVSVAAAIVLSEFRSRGFR